MSETAIVQRREALPTAFEPQSLGELVKFCDWMSECDLLPEALRGKPRHMALVLIKGRELGFTMMQSLACINVIKGRAVVNAEGIVAKVLQHPKCLYFSPVETTDEVATYETLREGAPKAVRLSFTLAQAKRAGLAGNDNYRKHTEAMLRARCAMALARAVYPDAVLGLNEQGEGEEIAGRPLPVAAEVTVERHAPTNGLGECPDAVRDDIANACVGDMPLSLDDAARIYANHERALGQEDRTAVFAALKLASGASAAKLNAAIASEWAKREPAQPAPAEREPGDESEAEPYSVEQAEHDYAAAGSVDEVTAIDAEVAKLGLPKRSTARARLIAARKDALDRLRPPPDGTTTPRPANGNADAKGAAGEAPAHDGTQAKLLAAMQLMKECNSSVHVARHYAAHVDELPPALRPRYRDFAEAYLHGRYPKAVRSVAVASELLDRAVADRDGDGVARRVA